MKYLKLFFWLVGIFRKLTDKYVAEKNQNIGANEVITEIEVRNDNQAKVAEKIDHDIAGADLGDLEQRMQASRRDIP